MIRFVVCASLSLGSTVAFAAEPFDWKKTLEQPLSPGTVAILVEHGGEPEVQERWRTALKSEDTRVRSAAARAIYAAGEKGLASALREALEVEKDARAAEEQIRALAAVGTPDSDASIVAAARRVPELRVFAWNHLGRARGTDALVHLAAVREGDGPQEDRRSLVRAAVDGGRSGIVEAGRAALKENDPAAWFVVWESLLAGGTIASDLLVASVSSPEPRIRALTYWCAALVQQHGRVPGALAEALKTAPEAAKDRKLFPSDAGERMAHFTFGLYAQAIGGKRRHDVEWVKTLPAAKAWDRWPFPSPATAVVRLFSKDERKHLVEMGHLPSNVEDRLQQPLWRSKSATVVAPDAVSTAAIYDFPRGYVSGLTALTGCRDREITANVDYAPNGRPQSVSLIAADDLSEDCARTGRILLASRPFSLFSRLDHVLGSAPSPAAVAVRLLPLEPASVAWDEGHGPAGVVLDARHGLAGGVAGGVLVAGVVDDAPPGPVRVGGTIREPKKLNDVRPFYPAIARQARVQGVVILEALIAPDGRVEEVTVLKGVPLLDEAAMEAVRQWVYTPTLLNGVPVPVIMTVTVAFSLR